MTPEQIELDKPQSFENNFIHHMAIGEQVVNSIWTNTAAITIEKLIDEILKVKPLQNFQFYYLKKNQSQKRSSKKASIPFNSVLTAKTSTSHSTYHIYAP